MRHVCFPIITTTMARSNEWGVDELRGEKAFTNNFLLLNPIKKGTLANADIFLLSFLHKSDVGSLKFNFTSTFMPNSFSHSVVFVV